MTAIVGIINRNGTAFAADSAATHSLYANQKKITNHANKVFELSRHHPVGIAICGQMSFMGLLWEDIIKLYRNSLQDKAYSSIPEYVTSFIDFVGKSILPHFNKEQEDQLAYLCQSFLQEVHDLAYKKLFSSGLKKESITDDILFNAINERLDSFIKDYSSDNIKYGKASSFIDYSQEQFLLYSEGIIDSTIKKDISKVQDPIAFKNRFTEALFAILISKIHVYLSKTELIIWGYGEKELFPSVYSIHVSAAFDSRIKWTDGIIRLNTSKACILPFAQTDVANTVVRGVDQTLRSEFSNKANSVLNRFKKDLQTKFKEVGAPDELDSFLEKFNLQPYTDAFTLEMDEYIQSNYIDKMMETVSYLMKEDLADMAESLVRMTCLKRHVTSDEETVGGPVDVAVITKGDGYVWIKRKHYFPADLNHHYFER